MAEGGNGGAWSALAEMAKSIGLGGLLLLIGFAVVGVAIYKAPEFADTERQLEVVIAGVVIGGAAIMAGSIMLWRMSPQNPRASSGGVDLVIAAPMAGFGADGDNRKATVELVQFVEAAMKQLPGVATVHSPASVRSTPIDFEDPAAAFDVELDALSKAKRYLLILPAVIPTGTSVLVTAGLAIALKVPCAILLPTGKEPPYLLKGAVTSKKANVRLYNYENTAGIKTLITNNGLRLFGEDGK